MIGGSRRAMASAGVFLACCVGLTVDALPQPRDAPALRAPGLPCALRGGAAAADELSAHPAAAAAAAAGPLATTSALEADGRRGRGASEQEAQRQAKRGDRWRSPTPALKVYMHVASVASAALFRAFLALADRDATPEGTLPGVPASGKRRRQTASSHQNTSAKARWVLCFTDGGTSACPQLDVRCLQGTLERQWTAAPGGPWWREILDSAASGKTAVGGEVEGVPARLYGPFACKDMLTQVATLVRRLFLLRCSGCSRPAAGRNILQWPSRPQHRMTALLAEAVSREAIHRCSWPSHPDHRSPCASPSSSSAGMYLAEGNTSDSQQGRAVEPLNGMVPTNEHKASFQASTGDMEQAVLSAESVVRAAFPPVTNCSPGASMQLNTAANRSVDAESEEREEGEEDLGAAVGRDAPEPPEPLRNMVAALGDGFIFFSSFASSSSSSSISSISSRCSGCLLLRLLSLSCSVTHSHTHTLSLYFSLSLSLARALSLARSLPRARAHTHSRARVLSFLHTLPRLFILHPRIRTDASFMSNSTFIHRASPGFLGGGWARGHRKALEFESRAASN